MILKKLNINSILKNDYYHKKNLSLFNNLKKNLFTKPDSSLTNDSNNKNGISLNNIFEFNPKQMKVEKNKIFLNQYHLGIKTTRNETYLVYETEESSFYVLGKNILILGIFLALLELVRRYKKEGVFKYILYSSLGGLALASLVYPRFSSRHSIRKIELNKSLDMIYITLYNNKMLKVPNRDVYLNTKFRLFENLEGRKFLMGIQGRNYYGSLRHAYIPNFDLFNCVIRGFQFESEHTSKF